MAARETGDQPSGEKHKDRIRQIIRTAVAEAESPRGVDDTEIVREVREQIGEDDSELSVPEEWVDEVIEELYAKNEIDKEVDRETKVTWLKRQS